MSQVTSVDGQDPYVIRRGEPSDADAFCSLFETVWDHERDREWFRWKYVENPSVDHVPMFVAEADGELVGTRPYVALRMRAGEATPLALLTADTMVHPDHRRRGLFTRMTERSLAFYADREPEFSFNQPNERSLSGYRKLGWQPLDAMTTYFRVQNPGSLAAAKTNDGTLGALARAATPLTDAALAVLDRYGSRDPDLAVHSEPDVAVEPLVEAYRNDVPDAVHALRDERFYRWQVRQPRLAASDVRRNRRRPDRRDTRPDADERRGNRRHATCRRRSAFGGRTVAGGRRPARGRDSRRLRGLGRYLRSRTGRSRRRPDAVRVPARRPVPLLAVEGRRLHARGPAVPRRLATRRHRPHRRRKLAALVRRARHDLT